MDADLRVDDEEGHVRLFDRGRDLTANLAVHWRARIVGQSAGVDEPERPAIPLGTREVAIARRPRFLGDDRAVVADDAVEQRGLADVGAPDERDDRDAHAACGPVSAGSPSWASTSMKSYEGNTGIGSTS